MFSSSAPSAIEGKDILAAVPSLRASFSIRGGCGQDKLKPIHINNMMLLNLQ